MVVEPDDVSRFVPRRRERLVVPRRRQIVVRFSDDEMEAVRARAALAGSAVGAWIGHAAVLAASGGMAPPVGLPDLLRLHADVVLLQRVGETTDERVAEMLARLDAVIDVVVAEMGRGRS